ncbi:MAG: potassium transporter Kup [Alphaproteobacteria bacterium]|nr:potassium transporter Kup [Alphaproteobacteria bacterium]
MEDKTSLKKLALGAIGVVYGDIGTSPLYTMREVFAGANPIAISVENVFAILSLIFWSLILVVSVKYVAIVMRADNNGAGGIIALMALALRTAKKASSGLNWMIVLGIFGAALFFADGVITPAISVLSAVEGIQLLAPAFKDHILIITLIVLFGLFWAQKRGTGAIGAFFGPVMCAWFVSIAIFGVLNIYNEPRVLMALNPKYAIDFVIHHKEAAFFSLGGVVLALTGAEALYADIGHFGRKPIEVAWFWLIFPSLTLNYFGQGALLIHDATSIRNPFYLLAPSWALIPMIILATAATIIASQAVISGSFSVARQAMQLGYSPRMNTEFTSEHKIGQVYLPFINWMLFIFISLLVVSFKSSTNLGAAYGMAVTGTMVITTILTFSVAKNHWKWGWFARVSMTAVFLVVDFSYFGANAIKIEEGGWIPLLIGLSVYVLMITWKQGSARHLSRVAADEMDLEEFIRRLEAKGPHRIEGMGVYLKASPVGVPRALLRNLYHYHALHDAVVIVTVKATDVPHIPESEQVKVEHLNSGFHKIYVNYGFKDAPDIPHALELSKAQGIDYEPMRTTYFLGKDSLRTRRGLRSWREKLFAWMFKNAWSATDYFRIPPSRVIELGSQRVL